MRCFAVLALAAGLKLQWEKTQWVDLHSAMRAAMDDDDDDVPAGTKTALLDTGTDDGYDASASELAAALGPRWQPQELEQNADASTNALLKGIAGQKSAVDVMTRMLRAMP